MKIHSSSLTFSPARPNPQQTTNNKNAENNTKIDLPASPETLSPWRANPADKIAKVSATAQSTPDSAKQNQVYTPIDKRTLNAINAYQLEINKTLQNQSANSIIGVDTYA